MAEKPLYVKLPQSDYQELMYAANQDATPMTVADRAASAAHTTIVVAALAGAVTAGSWGWAKAMDWLEEREFQRRLRKDAAARAEKA